MAEALRRLLWLIPMLALGSLALFGLLTRAPSVRDQLTLPLFYNPSPVSAQGEAERLLRAVIAGDEGAEDELVAVGGAVLPYVLPELSRLNVRERRRVSVALLPIVLRMGRGEGAELLESIASPPGDGEEAALLFWERFYQEHDLDYRPISVARLVRRLSERQLSLRRGDLLTLDTYALPFLVEQLGWVRSPSDVARVHRLVPAISHATGQDFELSESASVADAKVIVTRIRRYFDEAGPKWTDLDRFETLAARLSQTAFAVWAVRTVRVVSGMDAPVSLGAAAAPAQDTLILCLLGLGGALLLGPVTAAALQLWGFGRRTFRGGRLEARTALSITLALVVPGMILHAPESTGLRGLLAATAGGTVSAFLLHRELTDRMDWRSHHVLRSRRPLRRLSAVTNWLAPSIPTFAPIATAEVIVWVACLELGSGASGLTRALVLGYEAGDIELLMAVGLGAGLATAAIQVIADAALGTARWQRGEA